MLDATLGVVRDRLGLQAVIDRLQALAFSDDPAADPALVALFIAKAALQRQESRGGHWRSDFPQHSSAWAHRLVQRLDASELSRNGVSSMNIPSLPTLMLEPLVRSALLEDLGRAGDITTHAVVPARPVPRQPWWRANPASWPASTSPRSPFA